jgi:hypothetical protein
MNKKHVFNVVVPLLRKMDLSTVNSNINVMFAGGNFWVEKG